MTTEPHPFFVLLCEKFLELHPNIVRRLWGKLYPGEVQALIVQAEFSSCATGPEGIVLLAQRIPPQLLLKACLRLSPEDGRRRDKFVVMAEAKILARVDADGEWA
jgi:hypothetical protein